MVEDVPDEWDVERNIPITVLLSVPINIPP
jgi:hypothetical protein